MRFFLHLPVKRLSESSPKQLAEEIRYMKYSTKLAFCAASRKLFTNFDKLKQIPLWFSDFF